MLICILGGAGILGHAKMYSPMFRQLLQAIEGVGLGRKERRAQLLSVEYSMLSRSHHSRDGKLIVHRYLALADSNNPPPKQQEEVAAAYRFLLAQGVPAETIVIGALHTKKHSGLVILTLHSRRLSRCPVLYSRHTRLS